MKPGAVWEFIAGDSRLAPVAVAVAVGVAAVMLRGGMAPAAAGTALAAIVGLGLAAAVFERR